MAVIILDLKIAASSGNSCLSDLVFTVDSRPTQDCDEIYIVLNLILTIAYLILMVPSVSLCLGRQGLVIRLGCRLLSLMVLKFVQERLRTFLQVWSVVLVSSHVRGKSFFLLICMVLSEYIFDSLFLGSDCLTPFSTRVMGSPLFQPAEHSC